VTFFNEALSKIWATLEFVHTS